MAQAKTLVLDASVVVKWFNREEHTEKAIYARDQYEKGKVDLIEPELLAYELGNSLRYNPNFGVDDVRQSLSAFEKLQITTQSLTGELARNTVESAFLYGLTLYDSAYVALAKMTGSVLYTADTEIVQKVAEAFVKHVSQLV